MPLKEAVPAFLWAGVVIGITAAVLAGTWYQSEIESFVNDATEIVRLDQ